MRIAVTGATGYVGASLIAYLVQHFQRYEIIALVRETSNVRTLEKYSGIKIMKIDFFDPLFLDTALENLDVLVHTAALVSYFKSDYTNMVKANILLTRELVNASLRMNVKKFIHISSVAAIGINECFENGSDESISNEQSVFEKWQKKIGYMNTKYQAELEVIRATEENLDTVILNPGIIIGSYVDHVYGRGKIMMEKILSKKISIVPKGGAAFVGIEDVLCSIVKAITMGKKGERYIIVSENISYKTLILFLKPTSKKLNVFNIPKFIFSLIYFIEFIFKNKLSVSFDMLLLVEKKLYFENDKSVRHFGLSYKSVAEILNTMYSP